MRSSCTARLCGQALGYGIRCIHIVSVHAPRLAVFFFVANLTFHQHIGFEIGKWSFADQTFFVHNFLRTIQIFLFDKREVVYFFNIATIINIYLLPEYSIYPFYPCKSQRNSLPNQDWSLNSPSNSNRLLY